MKNFNKKILVLFILFIFNDHVFGQEINPSILENLTPEQIKRISAGIGNQNLNQNSLQKPNITESTKKITKKNNELDSTQKYGYDFFSTIPTSISAVGDLPLPNEYVISLKDQFTIILSGSKEAIFDLEVKLDGSILFPELGSISVVGESFADVKTKLKNLIDQSYIGVNIDISLKNLAAKKITIVGAVNNPGTYLVNPFSTISSALAYSGGVLEIGSLRNIKLKRINGKIFNFDLYDLLMSGDRKNDITIESGDVILVNAADQFVQIKGDVKRPATYEVIKSDTIKDVIDFALGNNIDANMENISLMVINKTDSVTEQINTSDIEFKLNNHPYEVRTIEVYSYRNYQESEVLIRGAIKEQGYYSLSNSNNLEDIIDNIDFVDVYPWLAVLEQFDEKQLIKSTVLFSLNDRRTFEGIKVLPNSKIFFANLYQRDFTRPMVDPITKDLINDYTLKINHQGASYKFPIIGKYKVSSLVDLLGLDMSDVDPIATYISPLKNTVTKMDYKEMEFIAEKYHVVSFRSPVMDLISVSINGAIDYPGIYTLQPNSTINDLYQLIGNFKDQAFLDGIIFKRQSVRERQAEALVASQRALNEGILSSIQKGENIGDLSVIQALSSQINPENLGRIAGDFSPDSISSIKTVLFDGDSIFIPRNPNIINVFGEVLNPTSFEYSKGISVRDAVANAGGYKDFANKSKVYVIKANGLIEHAKRNIFVKNVKLEPGDTIVVPRKIYTNNPGIDALLPITNILSNIAFSAAALESLSNNSNN